MAIRFGVMGCGGISSRFCGVLNACDQEKVLLHGVAARDMARAEAFAATYHAAKVYKDYRELAEDPAIDIVYIGTVNTSHEELVRLCLENGRRVLCEKPLVFTAKQAEDLFALAKEKNLLLLEGMWTRCNPVVRKVTEWVAAKAIGDAKLVTAKFNFNMPYNPHSRLYDPAQGGGALYDVGVYVIEFATGVLGENPDRITGVMETAPSGVDANTAISLGFPSGALASLTCAVNVTTPQPAAIYGTDGYIEVEAGFWRTHKAIRYDSQGQPVETFACEYDDGFSFEIEHVLELIDKGAIESDLIPPKDTIACAAVFDALLPPQG
jgi:predicted dehydrogenase